MQKAVPRKEKLSFILHKFDRGGSPRVVAYLARGFADAGLDVEVIAFTDRGEVDRIITDLMGDDIPVRYLGSWDGPRALDLVRGLPRLVRALRASSPDIIVASANNVALISWIARTRAGLRNARLFIKTTNPIASSRHRGLVKALRRWSYRRVFRTSDGVLTLSDDESAEMRAAFPDTAGLFRSVANPYVTPAMLSGGPATTPGTAPVILGVGRLTAQKRLERLIEAFALVRDRTATLRILGEGEERAPLTALIERLGLADRVSLPGYVADVSSEYHRASLFVLTSDYEGLPAVVLEAMAANCPVLATDCFPAARSVVEGAEGCAIIERTGPDALANLIDEHLSRPRPTRLRDVAETYSIANGIASHAAAMGLPVRSSAQRAAAE